MQLYIGVVVVIINMVVSELDLLTGRVVLNRICVNNDNIRLRCSIGSNVWTFYEGQAFTI